MAGRKPLPSNLKSIKGTARKGRENRGEPRPDPNIPEPPDWLSRDALIEWGRVSGRLYRLGLLTDIDRAALASYCQLCGRIAQVERELNALGTVLDETPNGMKQQHALVGIANKAHDLKRKFEAEFGMTPSSRSRVTVKKADESQDEWSRFGG